MTSIHEADLKGNIYRGPIHSQSLTVLAFVTEDDKTDEIAQSKNEHVHCTYIQCFSFEFPCTEISLKFHCWDWIWSKNQAMKWDLGKIWVGKWDLYPPFRILSKQPMKRN